MHRVEISPAADDVRRAPISGSAPTPGLGPVYRFNPLSDSRWNRFLDHHPDASVFHSPAWLEALRRTYGYEPLAFTTCPPGAELRNSAVFCLVDSWLTGRRLVSLPFADHCDVLADAESDLTSIHSALAGEMRTRKLRYLEFRSIRPLASTLCGSHRKRTYCLHRLDLTPNVEALFGNLHKASTQRKLRRAEREALTYEEGRSGTLFDAFIRLWFLTRRRHLIPPQPDHWFHNLIECFGEALKIRVAFKDRQPVAAILTLQYKDVLIYKYGCSDATFHRLGGMQLLLWRAILEARLEGLRLFDLGRSEWGNQGLITFKDRLGAERSELTYATISPSTHANWKTAPGVGYWGERIAKRLSPFLPDRVFRAVGDTMYRHIG